MAKRRNPPDSTQRNDRASLARDKALGVRITALQAQITQLREQVAALSHAQKVEWREHWPNRKNPTDTITKYRVAKRGSSR